MSQDCTACQVAAPGESRWKGVALFVGAIVFCPCHLPATIFALGGLAALLGSAWLSWLVGNQALLYLGFGLTYVFVLGFGLRYLVRRRDAERRLDALHEQHAASPAAAPS